MCLYFRCHRQWFLRWVISTVLPFAQILQQKVLKQQINQFDISRHNCGMFDIMRSHQGRPLGEVRTARVRVAGSEEKWERKSRARLCIRYAIAESCEFCPKQRPVRSTYTRTQSGLAASVVSSKSWGRVQRFTRQCNAVVDVFRPFQIPTGSIFVRSRLLEQGVIGRGGCRKVVLNETVL